MSVDKLEDIYNGTSCTVKHCKNALKSFYECLEKVAPSKKQTLAIRMVAQIERLASGQRLSAENFRKEGKLPRDTGSFYALKRIPIRGYCWKSTKYPNTYYISHYIYKDHNKLKKKDIEKVHNNWRRIEDDDDES